MFLHPFKEHNPLKHSIINVTDQFSALGFFITNGRRILREGEVDTEDRVFECRGGLGDVTSKSKLKTIMLSILGSTLTGLKGGV